MIDSHFSPKESEPRLYEAWEKSGAFQPRDAKPDDTPDDNFSMVIPPPNVTGSLHIGHALNNTLQDILARHARMKGKAVLWQPGLDHAGIATQMVVERQLAERQEPNRRDMGREKFIEKVWAWKAESGGTINGQLRRLGASCDWSRERFTMDEGLSDAVRKVFVQLYDEGLIYRDKRLVNWDPHFETAVSDLEVESLEVDGHFWHFKYPLADGQTYLYVEKDADGNVLIEEERDYIAIATTRPETMLGDGAVAVHPSDTRYAPIVGKMVRLPLCDRLIPIIADEYPDPDFGSGAVKITGAHDFNDYQAARRHNLPMYILMDSKARMADGAHVPEKYRGLDRYEARKLIVADIDELGLLATVEDKRITQPFGDRSGVVIEPYLTDQWYVDAKKLAVKAIAAVDGGETKFVPENWKQTYYHWMHNIEPWCISRQLWWGHRIPAYYDEDGNIFVGEDEAQAKARAKAHHGKDVALRQDDDVLDTWFSSGLWPFSTLGWPEQTDELARFYPTTTLVTMFDIIFFWVARMMMFGAHLLGKAPFANVVIHARVVDEKGKKMSKSKGNIIDPLTLIDTYGADALRFTLSIAAGPGRDIRMSDKRVEGYRNFGTKLWNAARFCQMNECSLWEDFDPSSAKTTVNRWILTELTTTAHAVDAALANHRFDEAASSLYRFIWGTLCDWYVELIKPVLNGDDEDSKTETRHAAAFVLDNTLKLLHPIMPFITEELWEKLAEFGPKRTNLLIGESWPQLPESLINQDAQEEIAWVVDLISGIRSVRSSVSVPASTKIVALLIGADETALKRLEKYQNEVDRLARLEYSAAAEVVPKACVSFMLGAITVAIPLEGIIDLDAEKARMEKEIARCTKDLASIEGKLSNPKFMERAPEEVVAEQLERKAALITEQAGYQSALERLSAF